jgi:hypothetical protein
MYLNNEIMIGHMFQEHLLNLCKVFQQFREAHPKLSLEKSQLFQKELQYLRHIMSPEGITTKLENLKAIQEWPTLKNTHKIRSFVGLYTYYTQFISSFINTVKPLIKLTKKKQAFQRTPKVEAAFKKQKALCTALILAYLQPGDRFITDRDTSNIEIGGILSQIQDKQERVTAYYSKTLNKAERRYCITQQELLEIVRTLEHFCKYPYGQEFHLCTDHSALTWVMSLSNIERQTASWIQHLQEYNFTSKHHQGRKHKKVNALLRQPWQEQCTHCHSVGRRQAGTSNCGYSCSQLVSTYSAQGTTQRPEHMVGPNLEEAEIGHHPEWKDIADRRPTRKSYCNQWNCHTVRNGILERHWESTDGQSKSAQIILPRSTVNDVLTKLHSALSGGHMGVNKTLNKVQQRYY